jgi:FAD/FMN-containing dehydrogenase
VSAEKFVRGDAGYEAARRATVANGRCPDRFPDLIVRAQTDHDVVDAVRIAAERDWKVGVRSGGHSWAASHLRDGGLLLDLSQMTRVDVDPEARTATVEPGRPSSSLALLLREKGLFFPTGHCTGPAVGGYLLQGGFGWNSRVEGVGCMNVTGIDVVTAGGDLVHAGEAENADLFWAARGSGPGFFGVVTRFHLKLHARPPVQMVSNYVYPVELLDEVFSWAYEIGPEVSRTIEMMLFMRREFGDSDDVSILVSGPALAATDEEARDALALLETCPVRDRALMAAPNVPTDVADIVAMSGVELYPEGWRYAVDNMWTSAPIADLLPGVRAIAGTLPSKPSHMMWMNWGPSPERPEMAYSMEDNGYIATYAVWDDAARDSEYVDWPTERMRAMESCQTGIQLADENLGRRPAPFVGDVQLARIDELRAKWDPDERFHSWMGRPA